MTESKDKHYHIYVLSLKNNKYYIGITSASPERRLAVHKAGGYNAAEWTKIHEPIDIIDRKDLGITSYEKAEEFENKITRLYIKKYGIDNVRGGNLSYAEKMVQRNGWIWRYDDWVKHTAYIFLFVLILSGSLYILWDILYRH